jgi:hypothetical protein
MMTSEDSKARSSSRNVGEKGNSDISIELISLRSLSVAFLSLFYLLLLPIVFIII